MEIFHCVIFISSTLKNPKLPLYLIGGNLLTFFKINSLTGNFFGKHDKCKL